MPQTGRWTGDPVWLADVLRAEGVDLVEYPGWRTRGHGDFKDIRGVMVHHTGSDTATAASIATGRPDLPGPLSQLHIARDGTVTVVALVAVNAASSRVGARSCHAIDSKLVGPAYKEVAAKYAGQDGAVEMLAGKIKNGSQGVWGPVPMPPNAVTEEEAKILAEWVLSQK